MSTNLSPFGCRIEQCLDDIRGQSNRVYRTKLAGPSTTSKRSVCSVGNRNLRK
jgi:hypothetical protein